MRAGRRVLACAVAIGFVVVSPGAPAPSSVVVGAPSPTKPLPLTGRPTVRADGTTYVIDGKQTIPKGAAVRVEADVLIRGINGASLDVRGSLQIHGTQDHWVKIENVDFSATVAPENGLHFDMANLGGCRFVTAEADAFEGGLTIENSALQSDCKLALRVQSGFVRFMTANVKIPIRIETLPTKGTPAEVAIRTCWAKEITLVGPSDATIRNAELKGAVEASGFTSLVVDGCEVAGNLTFRQGPEGSFAGLSLLKCNVLSGWRLRLARPVAPKTPMEKVRVEKFYFAAANGKSDVSDKAIRDRIDDGADDESVSVKAFWTNPADRPHDFIDPKLRLRRPPSPE